MTDIRTSTNPIVSRVFAEVAEMRANQIENEDCPIFTAVLNGGNEVPSNTKDQTSATGSATLNLQINCTELKFNIKYKDLTSPLISAHIHEGNVGSNGPIRLTLTFPLTIMNSGEIFGVWGTFSGVIVPVASPSGSETFSPQPLTPALITKLKNGELYINLHTSKFPAGEIRGQIIQSTN